MERSAAGHAATSCATRAQARPTNTGMLFNIALNYGGRAGDRRCGAARDRVGHPARGSRRTALRELPLHGRAARSGSADSHERRDARQQLTCSGRSPTRRSTSPRRCGPTSAAVTCSRPCSPTRSASAATAASRRPAAPGRDDPRHQRRHARRRRASPRSCSCRSPRSASSRASSPGVAADEYVRITSARPRHRRGGWSSPSVVYACWWAAVPAPLSMVLLAIVVIAWLAFAVLRQATDDRGGGRSTWSRRSTSERRSACSWRCRTCTGPKGDRSC